MPDALVPGKPAEVIFFGRDRQAWNFNGSQQYVDPGSWVPYTERILREAYARRDTPGVEFIRSVFFEE